MEPEDIKLKEDVDSFIEKENKFLRDRGLSKMQHNSVINRLIIQFIKSKGAINYIESIINKNK